MDRPPGEFYHTEWTGTGGAATSGSYQASGSIGDEVGGKGADRGVT